MNSKAKILVVDDEEALRNILLEELSKTYHVVVATNGKAGFDLALKERPDLIIMDVMMPEENGIEACHRLRQNPFTSQIPVLMLTASAELDTLVNSFQRGADDFIEKPFRMPELKARIQAKLRREEQRKGPVLELGNLKLLEDRLEADIGGGKVILSALEFALVKYFLKNHDKVIARPQILADVWKNVSVTDRTVDAHLVSVRKKLAAFDHEFVTVYGAGYMLTRKKDDAVPKAGVSRRVSNV